jgi:hypothetical protein
LDRAETFTGALTDCRQNVLATQGDLAAKPQKSYEEDALAVAHWKLNGTADKSSPLLE